MDSVNQFVAVGGLKIPTTNIVEWRKLRARARVLRAQGKEIPHALEVKIYRLAGVKQDQARVLAQAFGSRKSHDIVKVSAQDMRTFDGPDHLLEHYKRLTREISDKVVSMGLIHEKI